MADPVPPVPELERICGGEGRDPAERRDFRLAYAVFVRKLSIRITWLLLHTRASANQVTVAGILIGLAGAALLAWNQFWAQIVALVLLGLSFVVDYSDGEIARYRARTGGAETNPGGAYLDWIGHYYIPATAIAALAYACFHETGDAWLLLAGLIAIFGVVRIAYSARDHVLLGLYRDRPQLRDSSRYLRAVLARQGGDPARQDLDADYEGRRAGAPGSGVLWHRFTTLGQLLVFPGFVNLVTLAVVVDLIASVAAGDYPSAQATLARSILIALLGIVHLLHQIRAAAQGREVLRRL
jgi:phosphatidylglycerophosphate synthase